MTAQDNSSCKADRRILVFTNKTSNIATTFHLQLIYIDNIKSLLLRAEHLCIVNFQLILSFLGKEQPRAQHFPFLQKLSFRQSSQTDYYSVCCPSVDFRVIKRTSLPCAVAGYRAMSSRVDLTVWWSWGDAPYYKNNELNYYKEIYLLSEDFYFKSIFLDVLCKKCFMKFFISIFRVTSLSMLNSVKEDKRFFVILVYSLFLIIFIFEKDLSAV